MATLAPPSADLPSHVWCVTRKQKHFTVLAPTRERVAGNPSVVLSFARRYHADMFKHAVCRRKSLEKKWPRITLEADYGIVIPRVNEQGTTPDLDLEVSEIKLAELLDKCNFNKVSVGLIDDFRAIEANIEFKGSKIDRNTVMKIEDLRSHLNDLLKSE